MLFGQITQHELELAPFNSWFVENYQKYEVQLASKKKLTKKVKSLDITIYMGTWCGDSKREVPRFIKILDELNFDKNKLTIHALNQKKQGLNRGEKDRNIHRVPTVIFSRNSKELGRIVEKPLGTIEQDLELLLLKGEYQPNYYGLEILHQIVMENGFEYLTYNQMKVVDRLRLLVKNVYEIRKYGQVYERNEEFEKAIAIFKLNASLFPSSDIPHQSLGLVYFKSNNVNMAKKHLQKALELNPENEYAGRYLPTIGL